MGTFSCVRYRDPIRRLGASSSTKTNRREGKSCETFAACVASPTPPAAALSFVASANAALTSPLSRSTTLQDSEGAGTAARLLKGSGSTGFTTLLLALRNHGTATIRQRQESDTDQLVIRCSTLMLCVVPNTMNASYLEEFSDSIANGI